MGNLEDLIKKSLRDNARPLKRSENCPDELRLSKFMEGSLPSQERKKVQEHLADCDLCLDLVVTTRDILNQGKKAKRRWKEIFNKQKWLIFTLASFALSFFVRKYFMQFLFLSLILGIKWALSAEGSRNLVMIFRSLHQHENADLEKKGKIFERK